MITRNIPHGTTREVEVLEVETSGPWDVLTCKDPRGTPDPEGYILFADAGTYRGVGRGRGWITFRPGGPFGGHWVYSASAPDANGGEPC